MIPALPEDPKIETNNEGVVPVVETKASLIFVLYTIAAFPLARALLGTR